MTHSGIELRERGQGYLIVAKRLWSAVACYRFWSGSLLPSHAAAPPDERLPLAGESLGAKRRQQATSAKRRQAARTPRSLRDNYMTLRGGLPAPPPEGMRFPTQRIPSGR